MATTPDGTRGKRAAHFTNTGEASAASEPRRTSRAQSGSAKRPTARRATKPAQAQGVTSTHMSERTARATQRAAAAHQRRSTGAHPSARSRRHSSIAVAILAVLAVAAVVGVGFLVGPHLFKRTEQTKVEDVPAGQQVIVTVPDGSTGSQIAALLIENHVLSDDALFYQEIQKQNADAYMKSGTYQFVTGATPSEVVKQLVSGPNASEFRLKLAEGLTVKQTAAQVESQTGITADEFLEQAKASNYQDSYPFLQDVTDDSLEGFLFGKTYDLGTDKTADSVIRAMLDQYQAEVGGLDMDSARDGLRSTYGVEISDYGILKLASIIEREATTDEDRPLIASVFYNRLKNGMYLQSDATMMYVTGGEVTSSDLETDSPYNTYKNPGLTPTPICSPSLASIEAAMHPADTTYYYFFINENVHQFSETYEEHQQAISESIHS